MILELTKTETPPKNRTLPQKRELVVEDISTAI
jgi:hypothetical protein